LVLYLFGLPLLQSESSSLSVLQSSGIDVKDPLSMLDSNPVSLPHQQNDSLPLGISCVVHGIIDVFSMSSLFCCTSIKVIV